MNRPVTTGANSIEVLCSSRYRATHLPVYGRPAGTGCKTFSRRGHSRPTPSQDQYHPAQGAWQACLQSHPDQHFTHYILKGITEGFRIGFDRRCKLKAAQKNMHSAVQHPLVIDRYLQDECKAGRVMGPFHAQDISPPVHISRFGVIPTKHRENSWRLIVDLSAPDTQSVNDGIQPKLCSLEYTKIGEAVKNNKQNGAWHPDSKNRY